MLQGYVMDARLPWKGSLYSATPVQHVHRKIMGVRFLEFER